jgi:hypothetical protein
MNNILLKDTISPENGLVFAQNRHGELVSINDVPNGLACDCSCPFCESPLVAKNNSDKISPHFAHKPKDVGLINLESCSYEFWRSLHYLAYLSLKESPVISVPDFTVSVSRMVGSSQFNETITIAGGKRELKSVDLVKVNNRRLMDIIVTLENNEKVIVYPDIPVFSAYKTESDINENPKSWNDYPVMKIKFGTQYKPKRQEAYPLASFLSKLHHDAKREWYIEPESMQMKKDELIKKADEWTQKKQLSEKQDIAIFAQSWLNQSPIHLGSIYKGLKKPDRSDISGFISTTRNTRLLSASHLYLSAEIKDSNGNDIAIVFTNDSIAIAPRGLSGKAIINVVIDRFSSPSSWKKTWIKLPSEIKKELEAKQKEMNKHLLDIPQEKIVDSLYEAAVTGNAVNDNAWSALIAQGYFKQEDEELALKWLSLASRMINKGYVLTSDLALSIVKKTLDKDDSWSRSMISTMNHFGSINGIMNKLSGDEQFNASILSLSDKSPKFCSIFIPMLERLNKDHPGKAVNLKRTLVKSPSRKDVLSIEY